MYVYAQSVSDSHDVDETGLMLTELMHIQQADSEMDIDNTTSYVLVN